MSVALTGEAATDGAVAVGINLSFSLDPGHGFAMSRRQMAQSGAVHATVYRDLNDNGLRDPAEPFEKGALITTGTVQAGRPTNARGAVTVAGLTAYSPVAVGIDETSLADPMLAPRKALQVVVPRPGVAAEVEIGLVGGGDVEGAVTRSGGLGFEGLDLELIDASGHVAGTARSDFDGFFLFERVAYGRYTIRVSRDSASRRQGHDTARGRIRGQRRQVGGAARRACGHPAAPGRFGRRSGAVAIGLVQHAVQSGFVSPESACSLPT